jgi:hypothetical protein
MIGVPDSEKEDQKIPYHSMPGPLAMIGLSDVLTRIKASVNRHHQRFHGCMRAKTALS